MKKVLGVIVASGLVLNTMGQAFANPACDAVRKESALVDIELATTIARYPLVALVFGATIEALKGSKDAQEVIMTLIVGMGSCAFMSGKVSCQAFTEKVIELAYRKEAITKLSRQHQCGLV